jgi:HAMP domain-containing protein/CheY-like chemotaxis protein/signal transduction histidine kinase
MNGTESILPEASRPDPALPLRAGDGAEARAADLLQSIQPSRLHDLLRGLQAVRDGDFSFRLPGHWTGLEGKIADTFNDIAAANAQIASELERVGSLVGKHGQTRERVNYRETSGAWGRMESCVNSLIDDLLWPTTEVTRALAAVAKGDLLQTVRLDVDGRPLEGEFLRSASIVNTMIEQLSVFTSEVTRVVREVGTDGKLGGQAVIRDVSGVWKELTDSVNSMASNLTAQVRNISEVTIAVAHGDLSRKITVDVRGEILELKNTINTMVDQLNAFASEVTRVAREVGTEGRLGGQAEVPGVAGTWKDLTDNVNFMASNLTAQVRNIADVATAIANGDLSRKITVNVSGEILLLKETINTMVDQLNAFAAEVTRVAREVGTEGMLGGQAQVPDVGGTWKDLTDSVNAMAGNLTVQLRDVSKVATSIAHGDLSQKITVDVRGEILQIKDTFNTMVDQLNAFAGEVTRVAREVGTEGRLGGQANVVGVAGTWKDLTESVNSMANNLTAQVRNIADVATAIAKGDLSRKITVDVKGEILELKNTINTMVDQLNAFAAEVTRVAREVGTEGKLGGQAEVPGVAGTWKDLTDSVNFMASNLTAQVRNIAGVATAIAKGDLSKKITVDVRGEILLLKETLNTMVEQLRSFAAEVTRVAREVGTDGRLGGQAVVPGVAGTWKDLTDNVNLLAANLTTQVRNIAEVTTAVARGDLSRKITVDVKGEILELKNTINTMVDQLNGFAAEVTRVAREVGTEGKLGGQAQVPGVAGTWKDLTDNVNVMASNLTEQVRGIVKVVTAVADGDLEQKLTVKAKGEVAALAETINSMTETLAIFADQVTSVAREVGVEGRLGGQANVPGAAGTWKDLTGNVNLLAANLTTQVRAIAEVATAVTKGDLTRSIQVNARGEVAELKDNLNTMIDNLRLTTDRNTEQDWLKTNLARFTAMLQGQRDLATVGELLLSELVPLVDGHQGVIYQLLADEEPCLGLLAGYAIDYARPYPSRLSLGEGFIGQCARDLRRILVSDLPEDTVTVGTVFFRALPRNLAVFPVVFEGQIKAVLALASLKEFQPTHVAFLEQLTASIGIVLNSIEATMQTEGLLKQSQNLAGELQTQQKELQQTNEQLAQKAQQLAEQNAEVERKNQEIEQARRALEDKASELALTSKYKSEFLANMSHELRTPLNSILILGQQLSENPQGNLSERQVEFARTIYSAGTDLLNLISDILDLSKIESGTVTVEVEEVMFNSLVDMVHRTFRHEAEARGLSFDVEVDPRLGRSLISDPKRLQQVLKNLLSNAFKFTSQGGVHLRIHEAAGGWTPNHRVLGAAGPVVAFAVSDTGIGIPMEKQRLIFEAFQQADASTSRKYGGTGLGLAISRELSMLLGGEIHLRSAPGIGSTFTLYLPVRCSPDVAEREPAAPASFPAALRRPVVRVAEPMEIIDDDRADLQPDDVSLLIVEDDAHYARILAGLARDKGFKVLVAQRGADALELARRFRPSALSLDVFLPDMLGWTVLSQLKQDPETRHIPVQIVTADEDRQHGLARGAFSFLTKPTTTEGLKAALTRIQAYAAPRRKRLLVVEDNQAEQESIRVLLGDGDIDVVTVDTGEEALRLLREEPCDCVVLDLRLPDMSGFEVLDRIRLDPDLAEVPVVVFTGRALSVEEDARLHDLARSVVVKGVESPERLLDETSLFLHRVVADLPPEKQRLLERLHRSDEDLIDKSVLIVDDDVRNIFALSSMLERHGMKVRTATTGGEAITLLESNPDVAIVLMDIMMPMMDGYETMRAIRKNALFRRLPIVALTAKAMKGDREKCLQAGASDYLAKPVNMEQLFAALRMWLHR